MAGSKRWFRYQDDAGNSYSVNLDESNSEGTVGGVTMMASRTAAHPRLPNGLRMRYVNAFLTATPLVKRKFWVGNPLAIPQVLASAAMLAGAYPSATDGATVAGAWTISSYRGERNNGAPALNTTGGDTGLTDGDVQRDA